MKLFYRSEKYKRYARRVARKAFKRNEKRQRRIKDLRRRLFKKDRKEAKRISDFQHYKEHIYAPINCSFLENTEEVIRFLNKLERALSQGKRTFVVLKRVELFDYGAVAILLSVMSMFKLKKIGFNGDLPESYTAKKIIVESGFFDHLLRAHPQVGTEVSDKENQIFTHSDTKVVPSLGLKIMEATSLTVWGEKRINTGLQSVLMELMQNTNNHASTGTVEGEKHWWLSVNHDKVRKNVSFAFIDHGVGILASLDRKPPNSPWYGLVDKAKQVLGINGNNEFIRELLLGNLHKTATNKTYRGKGLPNIKRMLDYRRIDNLHIISNNVRGNVQKADYEILSENFTGTFFYWEISVDNISKIWKI